MPVSKCPVCDCSLEADGICVACFLNEAIAAPLEAGSTPSPATDVMRGRLELPCEFARYRLVREVAAGGMGVVYEAEDHRLRRTVALKVIRSAAFASASEKARFHIEAEAAARLDHPNIVPVHEVGEWEGQPFFTMKLLPGGTLAERLKSGPLEPREAAALMAKIARAVHHAHERGVLHRDLKPGNVLLDAAGEPMLTDFGLAKVADTENALTLTQAQLGTPSYMSPEQAGGHARDVRAVSDVWALGAMFYQMLAGHVPFRGESTAEVFRRIASEEPEAFATGSDRSVGSDLSAIAHRCLEKEPAKRLPTALFLAEELERFLAGVPILSRRITKRERTVRWMRRNPLATAATAIIAVLLIAGISGVTWQWQRALDANTSLSKTNTELDLQLRRSTAMRLAGQARVDVENSSPLAALLAAEAVELTRRVDGTVMPDAFNALGSVLDRVNGRPIANVSGFNAESVSADGIWLAAPQSDDTVRLVNLDGSGPDRVLRGASVSSDTSAISADGGVVAASSRKSGAIRAWRTMEPEVPVILPADGARCLAMAPSGEWLAAALADGEIRLWDLRAGAPAEPIVVPAAEKRKWQSLVFSPNLRRLISTSGDDEHAALIALDLDARTAVAEPLIAGHRSPIRHAAFSPDERWLATLGERTLRLTLLTSPNAPQNASVQVHTGRHQNFKNPISFSSDSAWLCYGNAGSTGFAFPVDDISQPLEFGGSAMENVAVFTSDRRWFLTGGGDKMLRAWPFGGSRNRRQPPELLVGPGYLIRDISVTPLGAVLASSSIEGSDGRIVVWKWQLGEEADQPGSWTSERRVAEDIAVSPTAPLIAATNASDYSVYDVSFDPPRLITRDRFDDPQIFVGFGPDGRELVTVGKKGRVSFLSAPYKKESFSIRVGPAVNATAAAVGPDGRAFLALDTKVIRLVDTKIPQPLQVPGVTTRDWPIEFPVHHIAISPDGRWLAGAEAGTVGGDGILLWDISKPIPEAPIRYLPTKVGFCDGTGFSPDSRWLSVPTQKGHLELWDLTNPDATAPARRSENMGGSLQIASFSPDGQTLAMPTWRGHIHFWDTRSGSAGSPYIAARPGDVIVDTKWLPDGQRLIGRTFDYRLLIIEVGLERMLARARALAGRELTSAERTAFGLPSALPEENAASQELPRTAPKIATVRFEGPVARALAPETIVRRITGAAPGQGLDLTGPVVHAISHGFIEGAGAIGGIEFTADEVPGNVFENAVRYGWLGDPNKPDFGGGRDNEKLAGLFHAIRYSHKEHPLRYTLPGLTAGKRYTLQLLFGQGPKIESEISGNRVFDVHVGDTLVADDFSPTIAQGSYPFRNACSVLVHTFTATGPTLTIALGGSPIEDKTAATKAVVSATILKEAGVAKASGNEPVFLTKHWDIEAAIETGIAQRGVRFMSDGSLLAIADVDASGPHASRWVLKDGVWEGAPYPQVRNQPGYWRAYPSPDGYIMSTNPDRKPISGLARLAPDGTALPFITYADNRNSSVEAVAFTRPGLLPAEVALRDGAILVLDSGRGKWKGLGSLWQGSRDGEEPLQLLGEDPVLTAPVDLTLNKNGVFIFNRNVGYAMSAERAEADTHQRIIRWDGKKFIPCPVDIPLPDPSGIVADLTSDILYATEGSSGPSHSAIQRLIKLTPGKAPDTFTVEVLATHFGKLHGGSLGISEDGQRLAIADTKTARIYVLKRQTQ